MPHRRLELRSAGAAFISAWRTLMKPQQPRRDSVVVTGIGILYLVVLYWNPVFVFWAGIRAQPTVREWQVDGSERLLLTYIPQALLLVILLLFARASQSSFFKACVRMPSGREWLHFGLSTAVCSLLLAIVRLWPWTWQWPPHNALHLADALITGHQYSGILLWALATTAMIPMLEEMVFRFGVLRLFAEIAGSPSVGVIVSSALFGAAHLGGSLRPDQPHLTNALWLFLASLLLGWITVRKGGQLGPAMVAHASRNIVEFGMLFLALRTPTL